MARYERNRLMFFGSWDGEDIPRSASVETISNYLTDISVNANVFASKVPNSGEYGFYYANNGWEFNGEPITIGSYGISYSGTPIKGDLINVYYTRESSGWDALGADNESLTKDLSPDIEKTKNILGQSVVRHNGYEAEISLDPYYIDPSRKMYKRLLDNAIQELNGESQVKGLFAEAVFTSANKERGIMTGYCYVRDAWYIPQSTGGDTVAAGIPVNIQPTGEATRKSIVYNVALHEATIS